MNAVAPASRRTLRPWQRMLVAVAAAFAVAATAQIQIIPLPEQKPATVRQLGAHELAAGDVQDWADGAMAQAMSRNPVAAAVIVVVKDNNVLFSRGYGYADQASKKPVDPATTLFRVGSTSTLFTWTAVMQLVEQGKLDLDADINRYLDFTIPPHDGKPVTLRELMTHSAGFEDAVKDLYLPHAAPPMSNEAWLKRWVPARIFPAGEVVAYSNYGAALAGYIVQRAAGQPFDDYVEQHIFRRLGMQHATFRQPLPAALQADMAPGYAPASAAPHAFERIAAAPAGALSISGDDMGRFMIAQLQGGGVGDTQLMTAPTMQLMHAFRRASVPGLRPGGLGFMHLDRNGQDIIGQRGATRFFRSELALLPQQHTGLFVALDGAADGALLRELLDGFTDRYFPAPPQIVPPTLATAREHGALLVGRYLPSRRSASNFRGLRDLFVQTSVSMAPDGTLQTPGLDPLQRPARWREVKPFLWLDDASGDHLGAAMQDGRVQWLSTDALAASQLWLPVPRWQSTAWNLRVLGATFGVFLLAALSWPLAALVRRLRGRPLALGDAALRWYRLSRVTAVLQLLFAAGWWLMLPRLDGGTSQLDLRLRLLQLVGLLAVAGTIAIAVNAWFAWRQPTGWWRRLNSVVLLLAGFVTLWYVGSQHLLSLRLDY
ncbi:serine hydrolase domain-containing protein [Dyella soli]|uniref:Class A beta-lactamase-related serine hydrolase n=1 Tax=Dyella soli TaxID=522319 RepID=A0A4R0YEP7_9GAMM|nr:serine hydrolase domain-containing protein [Dyella soli]TCI06538.1 class A beta-lactamase-related serine hydrolase [Dyella soli]